MGPERIQPENAFRDVLLAGKLFIEAMAYGLPWCAMRKGKVIFINAPVLSKAALESGRLLIWKDTSVNNLLERANRLEGE